MPKSDLQGIIEKLLDKIADANGYGKGARTRYAPLRATQYTKVRKTLFPEGQLPQGVMKEELFLDIRAALVAAKDMRGLPCLSRECVERLDRVWQSYRSQTLVAPDRLHARWETLVRDHNIRPSRLRSESDVYWTLYPILYVPMLNGEAETFNKNNQAFLSGFQTRHAALPQADDARDIVWMVYCTVAAFCHRRLRQTEGRNGLIRHMKSMVRRSKNTMLASELLAHLYYDNPSSRASLRALKLLDEHGTPKEWDDWKGYGLGRAAITAISHGHGGTEPCRDLGNRTPIDALHRCRDSLLENGHTIQAALFELYVVMPDAVRGNLNRVYKETSTQSLRVQSENSWLLNDQVAATRAIAHYNASQGGTADIMQARHYVDKMSPYSRSQTGGLVRTTIEKIIDASDALVR